MERVQGGEQVGQGAVGEENFQAYSNPKVGRRQRDGSGCTLILTEGDSAKTLAVSGISVVGKDYYGVYPLKGKLLNVREANVKQITEQGDI